MKTAIITGSAGLIGSEACNFFHKRGYKIIGIDNDMRAYFFGEEASTKESLNALKRTLKVYKHYNADIRNYKELDKIFKKYSKDIEIIIHTAAQPSHDYAAKEPLTDFAVNANGTMNLLELTSLYCPKATFIYTSTNKVYGDTPNYLDIIEGETRWEINPEAYKSNNCINIDGSINESMSIDNSKHSIFGASKLAADVMCQEYGKYFGMNVGIFRGGCLTGPNHAGTELHGFLSYLVKCIVHDKPYTIFGNGKNVRDNIHSLDLVRAFWEFHQNPNQGETYNIGGGRGNDISILETIDKVNELRKKDNLDIWNKYTINPDKKRIGDHLWYISDLSKFKMDYPNWKIEISLDEIISQIYDYENKKN
jgi:CDP-paratose 2-epimerase